MPKPGVATALVLTALLAPVAVHPRAIAAARDLPASLSNTEFARMITEFSEPGGVFHSDNFTSNEPMTAMGAKLLSARPRGGVYIGVGPEQNFTFIAAARPQLAFILDIRRQAVVQHLLFKALFELSEDRADFLSRLFARPRPTGLPRTASIAAIWDAINATPADANLYAAQRRAVEAHLRETRGLSLPEADVAHLDLVFKAFYELGPKIDYSGYQRGLTTANLNFERLSLAADRDGIQRSFLASDENFQFVRDMHRRNLIVPIEGDFAGPKALRAIGSYVRSRGATVDLFYISNVELYLFNPSGKRDNDPNGGYRAFYDNVASLPRNDQSAFIRSADLMSATPLCPMTKFLDFVLAKPAMSFAETTRCGGIRK